MTLLALLGLVGGIAGIPRAGAAVLVNMVGIARVRAFFAVPVSDPMPSTWAPTSASELELLRDAHRLGPDSPTVQRALAEALLRLGKVGEATNTLHNNVAGYNCFAVRNLPECWLLRASVFANSGQGDEAVREWRRGADVTVQRWPSDQYQVVEAAGAFIYKTLLEKNPERADYRSVLAGLLWRQGREEEALADWQMLAQQLPQSEIEARRTSEALLMVGLSQETAGDSWQAIDTLHRALAENPRLILAYIHLESLYVKLGQVDQAELVQDTLAKLPPERVWLISPGGQEIKPGWTLYGYDVDPGSIEEQPLLSLVLYWRLPEGTVPDMPGWYWAGDHWLQLVDAFNLAPNAGFEQDSWLGPGIPVGYQIPNWIVNSGNDNALAMSEHDGRTSKVFKQEMNPAWQQLSIEMSPLHVQTGECFLFDGWMGGTSHTSRTSIYVKNEKLGILDDKTPLSQSTISLAQQHSPYVLCMPDRAAWLNFTFQIDDGVVYWDDIIIIRLALPSNQ
jgi:tetratricopeptide (TPR) repeat protein